MAGSPKSISIGGITFKIPNDCTPKVTKGKRQFTESEGYGDGTQKPIETFVGGKIEGIVVSLSGNAYNSLENLGGKESLTVVYESASKTYELTGFIVASNGLVNDTTKDKSEEFSLIAEDGKVREG